jgi:CTP synthase (UTP-ammonia lyase)
MKKIVKIGLIGDYNTNILAHSCIPKALKIAASTFGVSVNIEWLPTDNINSLNQNEINKLDGLWCIPGSPYKDRSAVLEMIYSVRTSSIPFLGTCGGYQHAILEFAINELGLISASHEEENPNEKMLLISALPCRLTDEKRRISILKNSKLNSVMGANEIIEEYRCGFGMNSEYSYLFKNSSLKFVAFNEENSPQAVELTNHPFFIGTAFQPERSALINVPHPLVCAFLQAAL